MTRKEVPRCVGRIFRRLAHRCRIEIGGGTSASGEEEEAKGQKSISRDHKHCSGRWSCGKVFFSASSRCLIYLAALIAYYLDNFSPFMVKFGSSFGIRWYGFSYLLAFFCGFLLLRWLAQRRYCALPAGQGWRLHSRSRR